MDPAYDTVEIEDMDFNAATSEYSYSCPCGDIFTISATELLDGMDIAHCPSCSLILRVVYDSENVWERHGLAPGNCISVN